jgi:amino acid adenylation domain-containing protein
MDNQQSMSIPVSYPKGKTLVDLFIAQARKTPDHTAVDFGDSHLTYRELDEQSNQLAHYLRHLGVAEETLVPICLHRSLAMIVGILGILKAGGAYVPIDPDYPADRIAYMLDDLKSSVLLTDALSRPVLPASIESIHTLCLDEDWSTGQWESKETVPTSLTPKNAAYVIYTSGSTGRPKGVLIEHENVVRLFMTDSPLFDFSDRDVWTMFHSFCFDFSVWEMYGALLFGGRLVIVPKETARDAAQFGALLIREGVTVLNQTPSAFYTLQDALVGTVDTLPVRYVIFGGEALNPAKLTPWHQSFPSCQLINMYGITETTVHVTYLALQPEHLKQTSSLIGKPIPTLTTYVLDSEQRLAPVGEPGELYVGGAGLARGYLNQPELTASRFIPNPFSQEPGDRLYRSGDLARQLPDGGLDYLGRIDEQVKLRGYRIELGEVENALLQYPGVKHAVVVANADGEDSKRLVGYVVMADGFDRQAIRIFLQTTLPDYMVPALLMTIDRIPLTSNGKVDRKALPHPDASELLTDTYRAPGTKTEEKLAAVWKAVLNVKRVGTNDNFFELGGNSLLAVKTVAALKQTHQLDIPITKLYQFPTVIGLADFLNGHKKGRTQADKRDWSDKSDTTTGDVAIIGMAGRFPGANTIDALWTVLTEGRETTRFFADNELDPTLPTDVTGDPAYVKARGIIDQADQFDAHFFGLNEKLASAMDPQQRIFLEITWELLEKTGHLPQQYIGNVGVWAGCGNNTYYLNNVLANRQAVSEIGSFQAMTVNEKDFIASRTAYQLNLTGPAVSVYSACSTSLLAITQAVDNLRTGQCDVAIAGGASVTAPINSGHLYEEGAMLSRDGHCTPFDAHAGGTVFSDGAGVVLLKLREVAERDGDPIFALIKGVGVNNDGGGKGSFTAPNAEGQAGAIRRALDDARVNPATISYVETHGTATPLGDPIEIEGLTMAFGEQPHNQFCAIGSIKSNMGHLTAAAGVAGLIKTTLALHHKKIPASLGFQTPNPAIDFPNSPFKVNTTLTDWVSGQPNPSEGRPRRAGVSSFGVGGTNVHVILEEYEAQSVTPQPEPVVASRPVQLVTWSAKSGNSLERYAAQLEERLRQQPSLTPGDVAFTLQTTRPAFSHRRFLLAATTDELIKGLLTPHGAPAGASAGISTLLEKPGEVVFMFPGQGSQYLNMGHELYRYEAVYRQAVDTCADFLLPLLGRDIRQVLYPETVDTATETTAAVEQLKNTRYTQPALFITEYALASLWLSWGIQPTIYCGHSIGEYVAAHLAGVFSLTDALTLVATRGKLISELPRGSMLSVRLSRENVQELIPSTLSIAAVNSHTLCVVAGPDEEIAEFSRQLDGLELPNRVLETSHAFHSAMMDPILDTFQTVVEGITLHRPKKPIVSTVSGTWLTDVQATSPHYWATHMRETVQFSDALETLFTTVRPLLLEAGPGTVTATLARQQLKGRSVPVVASLDSRQGANSEYQAILNALGQLWLSGVEPDWAAFNAGQPLKKLDLPTYAFNRKRCWIEPLPEKPVVSIPTNQYKPTEETAMSLITSTTIRKKGIMDAVRAVLTSTAGIESDNVSPAISFIELGLDSLALTQVSYTLRKKFDLPISFRQLNSEYSTPERLVDYLADNLPADAYQPPVVPASVVAHQPPASAGSIPAPVTPVPALGPLGTRPQLPPVSVGNDAVTNLFAQQLQIIAQQMAYLQGTTPSADQAAPVAEPARKPEPAVTTALVMPATTKVPVPAQPSGADPKAPEAKPFGAGARIERQVTVLSDRQKQFIADFTDRYTQKTKGSKDYAQEYRTWMADPRVVTGFKPLTKEVVYPIVIDKSKGSRLWDIDGNEYIDVLNGFGSTMFGYQPDMITKALHDQIERGYELGPQHKLAGEVCRLVCEFTGFERAALCNTGSEAVMGTLRIARTVTGRSLVVVFSGSYHGTFDEVIVRGSSTRQSYPGALGIMPESVQNILVLEYGTDESLQIIRERSAEIAAVLVEPVQSRRPEFRPVDFLKQVRTLTEAGGALLIFDEVITGFRMHPGGAQALFGIKADLATYGKVIGGGLPIGVLAGKATYMDALDGGFWEYGDTSCPQADITFFAGTFVRHPLALAAAKTVLQYMKEKGPALQKSLTDKATRLADRINRSLERQHLPLFVAQFGSLWKVKFTEEVPYGDLLFTLMRDKGIHIWDGFPCFMTEAHTDKEISLIADRFMESIHELIEAGILPSGRPLKKETVTKEIPKIAFIDLNRPPVPNAKLGRDAAGNPAWFVQDPDRPGKYLQLTPDRLQQLV